MALNQQPTYSKLVVAKYSPENGCYVPGGDVLLVKPRNRIPQKAVVQHTFVSAVDSKSKSKFGWVKVVPAFSFDDFVTRYVQGRGLEKEEVEHIQVMLNSVESLPDGTPVATDYKSRGVIEQSMQLTVHKVIFFKK